MEINGWIRSNSGNLSVIIDGTSYTVDKDHRNYKEILIALNKQSANDFVRLVNPVEILKKISSSVITVKGSTILYKDTEIINALTDRILKFIKEDIPFEPMLKLLENLMENPSRTAIQELYLFLENNDLPITNDGYLLAYRKVDSDYLSFHKNQDGSTNSNKVGEVVEMERFMVDDQRNNVCSQGLHFCSLSYIPMYHSGYGKVMVVKINPKDVVSIPSDYNNAKGRCCRYEVIAEHVAENKETEEAFEEPVVDTETLVTNDKVSVETYHNVRDSKGRFVKQTA